MASIAGNDLGNIQSERQTKDSGLFEFPLPTSDADATFILDLFGVTRRITIEGIKNGTTAELETFIEAIEAIVNGNQSLSAFVSSLIVSPSSINVLIRTFTWSYSIGPTRRLTYTLELVQGS